MNEELSTAPVVEVSNTTTESTPSEVVTENTETPVESQVPEKDERDKTVARLEKRLNRKHAEAAAANERARMVEERLAQFERSQPQQERQKVEVDPQELDRYVQQTAAERVKASQLDAQCNRLVEEGKKAFPDFMDAVTDVGSELPLFRGDKPTPALEVILEADNPAALLHYLGKNPDIAADLADLSPTKLARRLDAIERDIKQPPRASLAPKPHEPEKSGSSPDYPDPTKDPKAWIAARNKEAAAKRNR